MKNRYIVLALLASAAAPQVTPALAEVKKQDNNGFLVTHIAEVKASPEEVWKRLLEPKEWWDKNFSWSGSAAGFSLDAQPGGCFCELIVNKDSGDPSNAGRVEHMRVIHINPKSVLRMQGALGPLQSEAVQGTLTIAMAPTKDDGEDAATTVSFNYIVGGYMRFPVAETAKNTDMVIGTQFKSLLKPFAERRAKDEDNAGWKLDIEDLIGGDSTDSEKAGDTQDADNGNAPEIEVKPGETGR